MAVSARESEVLELVGKGLTNAQIGARLFISVRTVESHVSSLLRKLELVDRRALAAHAQPSSPPAGGGLRGAPEPFTSFVGRRVDLEDVAEALAASRLVTLTGPGGVGKTRLAVEAGRRYGTASKWFVDLVPAGPRDVVQTIAAALGVAERPSLSLEEGVYDTLASGPSLLVLDNCEHVLDVVAAVTQRLVQSCADVVVLATSRELLGVPGERVVPVRPLSVSVGEGDDGEDGEDAASLFEVRARAGGASIERGDRPAIAEICRRLDGMPLAIELAAARCATLGADGVLAALDDRFRLLAGARGADERHRSIRAVLDWSYDLLDDDERVLLRAVSVYHGAFPLSDAVAVGAHRLERDAAVDALGRVVAKSLAVRSRGADAGSEFRLLETVRAYAAEKLVNEGEEERVNELYLQWAVDTAGALEQELENDDTVGVRVDTVADDLRAALAWAATHERRTDAHVLARSVAHLAYARRFVSEAQQRYEEAAEYAATDAEAARDMLDAGHAAFAILRGDLGHGCFLHAAERAERADDRQTAAFAYALTVERANRFPAEFADLPERETLDVRRQHAHELGTGAGGHVDAQLALADVWMTAMHPDDSTEPAAQHALAVARDLGDPVVESSALDALATAMWSTGQIAESARISSDRVPLLMRMATHDPRAGAEQIDILHMASDAQLGMGDLRGALDFARGAIGNPLGAGALHVLHRELVVALCLTGRFDEALKEAAAMRASWERGGRPVAGWMAPATYLVALIHGLRNEPDGFDTWWELSDKVSRTPANVLRAFVRVRLALHEGRFGDAAAAVTEHRLATSAEAANSPWSVACAGYSEYLWSAAAEVSAARRDLDAPRLIAQLNDELREHLWARPALLRARGRLEGDDQLLRQAAAGFAAIDARFEEAATLALLDGTDGDVARAALRELGCEPPAR